MRTRNFRDRIAEIINFQIIENSFNYLYIKYYRFYISFFRTLSYHVYACITQFVQYVNLHIGSYKRDLSNIFSYSINFVLSHNNIPNSKQSLFKSMSVVLSDILRK